MCSELFFFFFFTFVLVQSLGKCVLIGYPQLATENRKTSLGRF